MIRKAIYMGLAAVSAWQLYAAAKRYYAVRAQREKKQALSVWENEGGNPAPARPPREQHA
jgi:uncharacterized protein YpmB